MLKEGKLIIFLIVLFSVCTLLLAGAQQLYLNAAAVFRIRLYRDILDLYGINYTEENTAEVFEEHFTSRQIGGKTYYEATEKHPGSIVFETEGAGLWSIIEIIVAVGAEHEQLIGMRVISQAETPGLGGRISEAEFQRRFEGVDIKPAVNVVKFAAASNEVDAIAGASKTSDALENIINSGIKEMEADLGIGGE